MSTIMQINPFDFFVDQDGTALDSGFVWIGEANKDPRQFPVAVYYDSALTIPASMPLRTSDGYVTRNNAPTFLYINGNYSVLVEDKNHVQVFYVQDFFLIGSGSAVSLGDLQNLVDPTKGVSLIPTASRLVTNIAELRTLPKVGGSLSVFVQGYYAKGDGGGGNYYLDASDITSADNGGSIIVAADGGRWKLNPSTSIDVRQFGAKADDGAGAGTNSFAAIQAAITYAVSAKIGEVRLVGKYMIADTLVMDTGIFTQSIVLIGDGATTQIRQTGVGKDAIVFSRTQVLRNSGLRDLAIYCEAAAGHGVNIEYACTVCFFTNVNITVLNPIKSLYAGIWSAFPIGARGCFDTVWEGGDYYLSVAHTAFGFDFVTNGTAFNENVFRNMRCSQSGTVQMFRIISTDNSSYLTNNRFENINFEICKGGGILCYNARGWVMENITFWDTPIYNNHLIYFATNTGLEAISNTLINIQRNGDVLNAGVKDINIQSGQDTVVINCWTPSTSNPAYDWNNKRVTVIGLTLSGETNIGQRVYVNYDNVMTSRASIQTGIPTILQSTNFATITKNGAGSYRFTFLIPRASANAYNAQATLSQTGVALLITTTKAAGFVDVVVTTTGGVATDGGTIDLLITG